MFSIYFYNHIAYTNMPEIMKYCDDNNKNTCHFFIKSLYNAQYTFIRFD